MKDKVTVFWFRRDLRVEDNVGLHYALLSGYPVLPVFIFDATILERLSHKADRRVDYIHQALSAIHEKLTSFHARLNTYYGNPETVFQDLNQEYDIQAVFCNRDYEPQAIERDTRIYHFFKSKHIAFKAYKDHVIFDKADILKSDGKPYTVYTPYAKKWRETLSAGHYAPHTTQFDGFFKQEPADILSLKAIGFCKTDLTFTMPKADVQIIADYDKFRDYPAMQYTTLLGMALRFGTISIRSCVATALNYNAVWLSELIWREFFMQILYHFPHVVHQAFNAKYSRIKWRNNEEEFKLWCEGKTGYPIVDAGMRQLNETGYMHNRVRMIAAGFLCKHLLIDWRWGEAYFAEKLNDYDLSANNGNWQWAAGCGCDAAPYFRIFNAETQVSKFDKHTDYIRKWVPEFDSEHYIGPMIDHRYARERTLAVYAENLI